ncbi:MAG: ZIP family metal transporter [bacterium]
MPIQTVIPGITRMMTLVWILLSTLAMSLIALIGLVFLYLREEFFSRILDHLIAFAAGSLIGGAFFHLLPEALRTMGVGLEPFLWSAAGFTVFLAMEQFMNWHHAHRQLQQSTEPFTYLILLADSIHNFLGGMAIGSSFIVSPQVGLITWLAAACHEIPQELGDFGILIHGGWKKRNALLVNFLSALTIVPGGLLAYYLEGTINTNILLPFAAGNFIYIAASDLIPEIKHSKNWIVDALNSFSFVIGLGLIYLSTLL